MGINNVKFLEVALSVLYGGAKFMNWCVPQTLVSPLDNFCCL